MANGWTKIGTGGGWSHSGSSAVTSTNLLALEERAAPSTPPGGTLYAYAPTDGSGLHALDDAGAQFVTQKVETNSLAITYLSAFTTGTETNATLSANQVCVCHVNIDRPMSLNAFVFFLNTSSAGKIVGVGLYDLAGNRLAYGTTTLGGPAGAYVCQLTSYPVVFYPGVYFLAWTCDSATPAFRGLTQASIGAMYNLNAARLGTAANASASGVLPTTLGAITKVSNQNVPHITGE